MFDYARTRIECLCTLSTFVWPFARVDPFMVIKAEFALKSVVAESAFEGFFVNVTFGMSQKSALLFESGET